MLLTIAHKKTMPTNPRLMCTPFTQFFPFLSAITRHPIITDVGRKIFTKKKGITPTCPNNGLSSQAPRDKPISVKSKSPALVANAKIPRK